MTGPACVTGRFLGWSVGEEGDPGRYEESEPFADGVAELILALSASGKAVGGRLNAGAACPPSLPLISLDEPGVGGGFGRGIVVPLGPWVLGLRA
jgi:hypothetical protein